MRKPNNVPFLMLGQILAHTPYPKNKLMEENKFYFLHVMVKSKSQIVGSCTSTTLPADNNFSSNRNRRKQWEQLLANRKELGNRF